MVSLGATAKKRFAPSSDVNASTSAGSSLKSVARNVADPGVASFGAHTICHWAPSVTIPSGTPLARHSNAMRSAGVAAHLSPAILLFSLVPSGQQHTSARGVSLSPTGSTSTWSGRSTAWCSATTCVSVSGTAGPESRRVPQRSRSLSTHSIHTVVAATSRRSAGRCCRTDARTVTSTRSSPFGNTRLSTGIVTKLPVGSTSESQSAWRYATARLISVLHVAPRTRLLQGTAVGLGWRIAISPLRSRG